MSTEKTATFEPWRFFIANPPGYRERVLAECEEASTFQHFSDMLVANILCQSARDNSNFKHPKLPLVSPEEVRDVLIGIFRNLDILQLNILTKGLVKPFSEKDYNNGSYRVGTGIGVFLALLHARQVIDQAAFPDQRTQEQEVDKLDKQITGIAKRFAQYGYNKYGDNKSASCWWMNQLDVGFSSKEAAHEALTRAVNKWIAAPKDEWSAPNKPVADIQRAKRFLRALVDHVDENVGLLEDDTDLFYPRYDVPISQVIQRLCQLFHASSPSVVEQARSMLAC